MAICPACAEVLAEGVDQCPHCGINVQEWAAVGSQRRVKKKRSLAVVALIVFGLLIVCLGIPAAAILPAIQSAREAGRRTQCLNQIRNIGLALQTYHSQYGSFPPAYIADADGKPMHSWRVLILPLLGYEDLYAEYDFSEPWDGPKNSRLLSRMPPVYRCPKHTGASVNSSTAYAVPFGEHCLFRGSEPLTFGECTDGLGNTILVAEVSGAEIPWTKPEDIDVAKHPGLGDRLGFSSDHDSGVAVVFADGRTRFLPRSVEPKRFQAMLTCDGGEQVDLGDF